MSNILKEHDHGRLHELKHLRVCGRFNGDNVNLKELMNTTERVQKGPVFEKLEELHLLELNHLEELCVGDRVVTLVFFQSQGIAYVSL